MTATTQEMLVKQMTAQSVKFDDIYRSDDPYEDLYEAPLEIAVSRQLTVVLCTGGPHVEAVATIDNDGGITGARIDGYWGGTSESWPVEEHSSLWRALSDYAEFVGTSV